LCDLGSKAFAPSAVCDEPQIHLCHSNEENEADGSVVQRNLNKTKDGA